MPAKATSDIIKFKIVVLSHKWNAMILLTSCLTLSCNRVSQSSEIPIDTSLKRLEIIPHLGVNNVNLGKPKYQFDSYKLKFNEYPMTFYKGLRNHKLGTYYPSFDSVYLAGNYNESLIPSLFFRNDSLVMLEMFTFPHSAYDSVIFSISGRDYSRFDIAKIKSDFESEIEYIEGDTILGTAHDFYVLKRESITILVVNGEIRVLNIF